ncbi:MAG TPA: multidrug effflux MFS transporter [Paraburkholderia sp.]|uniref:multidrug effflux MFS transporter n=1 Tax=Paraburkholderia sp. TaxID=1926495 RepID=UPI002C4D7A3F|nr:multidrug effflux MFS transporter [Paraburkholderia sp.]HTR10547.1 multidrug effflux MFS transporter [Paraburkholderia sp.]
MGNLQNVRAGPTPDLKYLLGFIIAIGPVSVDMYLPAAAVIERELGKSSPQLALAAYFAGFAAGQLTQGLVSDRLGRRAPLAFGLSLYIVASICCALAQSSVSLCVFRAIAAFGAAASVVVPRAMVRDVCDGREAAELMSDIMQVMSVAPVVAPLLGSSVLLVAGWRAIFLVAALYGVVSLILMIWFMQETLPRAKRLSIGFTPTLRLFGEILRERRFLSNALIGTFGMGALFAFLAGSPIVFLNQYAYTPLAYGLTLATFGVATIGFFRLNSALVSRLGAPRMIEAGVLVWLVASGYLAISMRSAPASSAWVLGVLMVFLLSYTCIPSNTQVEALSNHSSHAASATALMSTMQYSGGAIAGALVGELADGTGKSMAWVLFGCALGAVAAMCFRPRRAAWKNQ